MAKGYGTVTTTKIYIVVELNPNRVEIKPIMILSELLQGTNPANPYLKKYFPCKKLGLPYDAMNTHICNIYIYII